jgi:hypothetical protein
MSKGLRSVDTHSSKDPAGNGHVVIPARAGLQTAPLHWSAVGGWYTIGLCVGLGVAIGVLLVGLLAAPRAALALAVLAAATAGFGIGFALGDLGEALGGAVGGLTGSLGSAAFVRGALRRGGTRAGTAALVGVGALALAALALVPVLGYVEAVAVPALAARLRRRSGQRYAGLRILARD